MWSFPGAAFSPRLGIGLQALLPRYQQFSRGTRPNFAARLSEMSGKPLLIHARLLLKRAGLFILPANAATEDRGPGFDSGRRFNRSMQNPRGESGFSRVGNEA
jgi:hypothetical protein